eukprot:749440-Hanusia_phi.AAC.2
MRPRLQEEVGSEDLERFRTTARKTMVTSSKGAGPDEPWMMWMGIQHDDQEEAVGAAWADV